MAILHSEVSEVFIARVVKARAIINGQVGEISRIFKSMFHRGRFLSFPLVIGAVLIGVVSGKAIFGPPLDDYWSKKLQDEASAKDTDVKST